MVGNIDALGGAKSSATLQNPAGGQTAIQPNGSARSAEQAVVVKAETKQSGDVDKAALTAAVKKLNELVAPSLQSVEFSIDQESERVIVKVVDTTTQKVLRQIPNEEVLAFSKTLGRLQGLVVREKV